MDQPNEPNCPPEQISGPSPSDDVVERAVAGEAAAQSVETNTVERAVASTPATSQPAPRVRIHMIETLDGFANIAKATGSYNHFVNSLLCVAAVMLAEIPEGEVDKTIDSVKVHSGRIRAQFAAAAAAAQAAQTQLEGANDVKH